MSGVLMYSVLGLAATGRRQAGESSSSAVAKSTRAPGCRQAAGGRWKGTIPRVASPAARLRFRRAVSSGQRTRWVAVRQAASPGA